MHNKWSFWVSYLYIFNMICNGIQIGKIMLSCLERKSFDSEPATDLELLN